LAIFNTPISQKSNQNNSFFVKTDRRISGVTFVQVDDKPFTPENLDELFVMVPGADEAAKEAAASLVIAKYDQTGSRVGHPYQMPKYKDFRNRSFEDLYDYASTPRTSEQAKWGKMNKTRRQSLMASSCKVCNC
jgi:hypothetical protein